MKTTLSSVTTTPVLSLLVALAPACSLRADPPKALIRPTQVILIRHAEKPADDKDVHLSPEGRKRAAALPGLFQKSESRSNPFPRPDFIFATKESKHSNRPVETVTPLAKELNLYLNGEFADEDYPLLAAELLSNPKFGGKTVLVCWHHEKLPGLARELKATDVPVEFKDHFDRVWVVRYDERGEGRPLVKLRQDLLPGDSKE
jgi:broad specificity phosphatase PhoE